MRCPRCGARAPRYAVRTKEERMPKITVAGGPSNADARPGEVGYIGPPAAHEGEQGPELAVPAHTGTVLAAAAPEAPAVPPAADGPGPEAPTADGPGPDYTAMTQAALREEAKARSLPVGGSKAELAQRLAEHDAAATAADPDTTEEPTP